LAIEFYRVFWSLQLPFSKPSVFTEPQTLEVFKESVNKVLPVIKEATVKERALMGKANSNAGSLKRRRESEVNLDTAGQGYFFAKYLTSPDLLDLEVWHTLCDAFCLFSQLYADRGYTFPPSISVSTPHST
jgi:hypothetical protein